MAAPTWLYGPALDLVVGCGAWSAPLLLLSYFSIASNARSWSVAFYGLALLFNYPHYMATIYRAYRRVEDFEKYRIFTVYTTALILLTIFLSHIRLGILPWVFTLYLTWSPWHYSGQNYGLFMMFARRSGATLEKPERHALYGAFVVSYLMLFVGFHSGASGDPLFLSLGIPEAIGRYAQVGLLTAFAVLSIFGWSGLLRGVGWRKLLPCFTLFSSQILWFLLPAALSLVKGMVTPQSRYSSGVLALMHSAQYLWITSYYARREKEESTQRNWSPLAYFAVLVAGGIALFIPGPWLASRVFHHDFAASFLTFTALVNLHHFLLDGAIWKLRDGRIASLLLNSREQLSGAASQAQGRLAETWEWISGSTASAHRFRVSAACLLVVWGTVDQARHYLSLRSNLSDLQRAAYLDSFDSQLQMRLAYRQMEENHPAEAEAALQSAAQSNPADPAPRQALLKFLIEHNRFDEASNLTDASLHFSPHDANLLMDRGLLASKRGDSLQAVDSWTRALAIDPAQVLAHIYLATEFEHEAKPKEAAEHYKSFLQIIARQPAASRPGAEKVIAIALRMADCQAQSSQKDLARQSYEMAAKLAAQTGQTKLESVADLNEAALDGSDGKMNDALRLYQHALELDDAIGDRTAGAQDWLAYGKFLDQGGFPARLVYACFVRSSVLGNSTLDTPRRQLLADASQQAAKRTGPEASKIRRDPQLILEEALALRR